MEKSLRGLFVELPNGGFAMYYPKTFAVNRMISDHYIYSAIAQGQILESYVNLYRKYKKPEFLHTARKIMLSLAYPYEKGGVALSDKALLEFPNYSSVPEVILNGDTLVHLRDYIAFTKDRDALRLYNSNMRFLVKILSYYDAPSLNLSRYSDVTPYRFTILSHSDFTPLNGNEKTQAPFRIVILYKPKIKDLKHSGMLKEARVQVNNK